MSNWKEIIQTKQLQPHEVDTVIYHSPCSDGAGSGYVVWKYFTLNYPGKVITYHPMSIGASPPSNLENKNVLVCDYSYKKNITLNLLKKVNKLLIIDHHKSAEKELSEIEDKYKIFDMNHSGAMLTWFYFFPETEAPLMIKYIEDRDIWTKKLPNTDDFASWFHTLPLDFKEYDKYLDNDLLKAAIETKGLAFRELNNYYIDQALEYAIPKFCKIDKKYYFVAYVNSTINKSDIGNKVFEKYEHCDFSATYSISDVNNGTSFSLRSTEKRADVSEIATALGGGGHMRASGIYTNYVTNHLPGIVYDSGQLYTLLSNLHFNTITINNTPLNVAYLNCLLYKHELATYLMQKKYNDVTTAEHLYAIKNKNELCKLDLVIVFGYDWNTNITEYIIYFGDSLNLLVRKSISGKYNISITENDKFITINCVGNNLFI